MTSHSMTSQSHQSGFDHFSCTSTVPPSHQNVPHIASGTDDSVSLSSITPQSGFGLFAATSATDDGQGGNATVVEPACTPAPVVLKIVTPGFVDENSLLEIFEEYTPSNVHCSHWRKGKETVTTGYVEFQHVDSRSMQEMQRFTFDGHHMSVSLFPSLPLGYRFQRCLQDEVGHMSIVVEALDHVRGQRVVLKRATKKQNEKYIQTELEILKVCKGHPHIVQLVEDDLVDGWLIIEHMGGGSFEKECEVPQNLTHRELLQIAEATSNALSFLHSHGIIHRDVKPHNIFMEKDDYNEITAIKLADMGVATKSCETPYAGTRAYAAPETFRNRAVPTSDMWSWASTIAHLATGIKPYEGDDKFAPYTTELRDAELPTTFCTTHAQCFAQQPSQRPTAQDVHLTCSQCLEQLPANEMDMSPLPSIKVCSSHTVHSLAQHSASSSVLSNYLFEPASKIDQLAAIANAEEERTVKEVSTAGARISDSSEAALVAASGAGDPKAVAALLAHGANVNAAIDSSSGRTALIAASEKGHAEVVTVLLAHGADVNANPFGRAALIAASQRVATLLAYTDVDAANTSDLTAIFAASEKGHTDVVKTLLAHGADVNAANRFAETALIAASQRGHAEVVAALLAHGADVDTTNHR